MSLTAGYARPEKLSLGQSFGNIQIKFTRTQYVFSFTQNTDTNKHLHFCALLNAFPHAG